MQPVTDFPGRMCANVLIMSNGSLMSWVGTSTVYVDEALPNKDRNNMVLQLQVVEKGLPVGF